MNILDNNNLKVEVEQLERKDQWTLEDDLLLAETVLQHIRDGSTQLKAFLEVAERLERTSAAAGFRWNSEVRKRYEKEIKEAKMERKNTVAVKPKIKADPIPTVTENNFIPISDILEALQLMEHVIDKLRKENEELTIKLENKPEIKINEDFKNMLKIIENARKLGILDGTNQNHAV
jgi:prespore-specific regulator